MSLTIAAFGDRADDLIALSGVDGGLVVVVDDDAGLAAQFVAKPAWTVHLLVNDAQLLSQARETLRSSGLHARVTSELHTTDELPFVDRLVSLLIAPEGLGTTPTNEVSRVLAPYGAALVDDGGGWTVTTQSYPTTIDSWTHYLHGADGNAVGHDDEVAQPKGVRWTSGPMWGRNHSYLAGVSAMVTDKGRLFTVVDEGTVAHSRLEGSWNLVARNAFSGALLWRRPITYWHTTNRSFRTGPAHLTRCLVADADRLFVTLTYRGPVTMLDAATGDSLRTYPQTDGAQEVVYHDNVLYVVTGFERPEEDAFNWFRGDLANQTSLMAVNAATGATLWEKDSAGFELVLPLTLAVTDAALVVHTQHRFYCLEPLTGVERWSMARKSFTIRPGWAAPTASIVQDVVLIADQATMDPPTDSTKFLKAPDDWLAWNAEANECRGQLGTLHALSVSDGTELWTTPCSGGFSSPPDVFYADNLVWVGTTISRDDGEFKQGHDLHSGTVMRTLATDDASSQTHHHRCHRNKATDNYIYTGKLGVELIDLNGQTNDRNTWVRGTCQYGIMPANGLIYAPPHYCGCFLQAKLAGMWAIAPEATPWKSVAYDDRRESPNPALNTGPVYPTDWPTYRHDGARSGVTDATLDGDLLDGWERAFGARLSAPVVAKGVVYVAEVDAHTLHAVSLADGSVQWSYTADGRIDSPPTIVNDLVIFGSGDGRVHCLRAGDGLPVWRFLAAPTDRKVLAHGQLESVWPVHGSVLVQDNSVWVVAGRSTYLDSGFACWRLDPQTGAVQVHERLHTDGVETGNMDELYAHSGRMKGALDDILSGDGTTAFMREMHLGASFEELAPDYHLFSMVGFLDDKWFSRSYWQYGPLMWGFYRGWPVAADYVPSGRILCMAGDTAYGYRRPQYGAKIEGTNNYTFYKSTLSRTLASEKMPPPDEYWWGSGIDNDGCVTEQWGNTMFPVWVRALTVTGDAVVAAGPHLGQMDQTAALLAGELGSELVVCSRDDGAIQQQLDLTMPPVWDGMAAVPGHVVVSCIDGTVRCFRAEGATSVAVAPASQPTSVQTPAPASTAAWSTRTSARSRSSSGRHGPLSRSPGRAQRPDGSSQRTADLVTTVLLPTAPDSGADRHACVKAPTGPRVFAEHDGYVCIEAERLLDSVDTVAWSFGAWLNGFSGEGYLASSSPDTGCAGLVVTTPAVTFRSTGRYAIYVRMYGENGWSWVCLGTSVEIESAGTHRVRVVLPSRARVLDRLLLQLDHLAAPSDYGPSESSALGMLLEGQ